MSDVTHLILASASVARRALLEAAGLEFEVIPAEIDETAIRDAILEKTSGAEAADVASVLAAEKARVVSSEHRDALVIGADQVLALGPKIFRKPGASVRRANISSCCAGARTISFPPLRWLETGSFTGKRHRRPR